MSEELVRNLISTSDMIVNGYAFNRLGENVCIVNLKENYREMYAHWQEYSDTGFYTGKVSV